MSVPIQPARPAPEGAAAKEERKTKEEKEIPIGELGTDDDGNTVYWNGRSWVLVEHDEIAAPTHVPPHHL